MFYLAYGMNTNLEDMAHRCPAARSLGKITLQDHALRFKYHADAEYAPGQEMECAIWSITSKCERALDALEGYPHYYNKKIVQVYFNSINVEAMIYCMTPGHVLGTPAQQYYNGVLKGYFQHDMNLEKLTRAYLDTLDPYVIDMKGTQ